MDGNEDCTGKLHKELPVSFHIWNMGGRKDMNIKSRQVYGRRMGTEDKGVSCECDQST